ncbi:MAG: SGNH/GDSL hydrolase family protein [Candidatus Solibacter sp.]
MIGSKVLAFGIVFTGLVSNFPAFAGNDKNYDYLALGDSVPFGMDITLLPTGPGQALPTPSDFTGYPEVVADIEHWQKSKKFVNAACPGETSGSFLDVNATDNGCHSVHLLPVEPYSLPAFKPTIGLHTDYGGSQMNYAVAQLTSNKHIKLVSLSIGANDFLLLVAICRNDQACIGSHYAEVMGKYQTNLTQILAKLRAVYDGDLVLLTYYAPSGEFIPVANDLNSIAEGVGTAFRAKIADGFGAFDAVSKHFDGDACDAGLLIRMPDDSGTCDIHPNLAGQGLLAAAIEAAIHQPKGK